MNTKALFKACKAFMVKNKETISIIANFVNLGLTVVTTIRGTIAATKKIEERKKELGVDTLSKKEIFKTTWKCYIPTTACIISSSAGYVISYVVHKNTIAALNAACSISETALNELRSSVEKNTDKETAKKIDKDAVEKTVEQLNDKANDPMDELLVKRGKYICYDTWSGQYFWTDKNKIDAAFNRAISNHKKRGEEWVTMYDILYELEEPNPEAECIQEYGYDINLALPDYVIDSELTSSGIPYLTLGYCNLPTRES